MFNYDPNAHGRYLGEYGKQRQISGAKTPHVRVDKAKKKFYKELDISPSIRSLLKVNTGGSLLVLLANIREVESTSRWRNSSYGQSGL